MVYPIPRQRLVDVGHKSFSCSVVSSLETQRGEGDKKDAPQDPQFQTHLLSPVQSTSHSVSALRDL